MVDSVAEAGRSKTAAVERGARIARKFPAILFGGTLLVAGLLVLLIGSLRALVEVTGAIFDQPKAWLAWLVLGGILLILAVFLGTVRNRGSRR